LERLAPRGFLRINLRLNEREVEYPGLNLGCDSRGD
jgi:hypothetical protein